jgi:hypothetical protein
MSHFVRISGLTAVILGVLTGATPKGFALPFTNGSFETPVLPTGGSASFGQGSRALSGWSIGGTGGAVELYTVSDGTGQTAVDGNQWIQFHVTNTAPGTTLSQTFTTVAGQAYGVFFALDRAGTGNESLAVAAMDPNNTLLATNNYQPTTTNWAPFYFNFTADTSFTTLEFVDTSPNTLGVQLLMDDVKVTPVTGTGPVITLSPTNETTVAWSSATFTASATGGISPLTVQWYLGTNAVAGGTNSTLTIHPALPANAGSYDAVFTDLVGRTATTTAAALTVATAAFTNGSFETPALSSGGSLSLTPGNTSLTGWNIGGSGGPVMLYTVLDGTGQTAYDGRQWIQFNANNTAPGATLSQTFTTVPGQAYGVFLVLALAGNGNESLGVVAFDPNGAVVATNNYQPTGSAWTPFYFNFTADSTNTTLELIDTSAATIGVDLLLDDVELVTVTASGPMITLSPTNETIVAGTAATFNASATGGNSPLTVQWYFGSNSITGATNASLTLTASPAASGSYYAVFTDLVGRTATTSQATLTVIPAAFTNGSFETPVLAPGGSLSLTPGNISLPGWSIGGNGGPIELYTSSGGTGQTAYDGNQWIQFNANNTPPGATLSQTFTTEAGQAYGVFFSLSVAGTGNESLGVVVFDSNGSVLATNDYQPTGGSWAPFYLNFTADTATTTLELVDTSVDTSAVDLLLDDVRVTPVTGSGPIITLSPTNETVLAWTPAILNASATGGINPLTVQWYFGTNAIAGATNSSLTINPALITNAGSYDAVFTDLAGRTATTSQAVLTVVPVPFTNGSFETPVLSNNGSSRLSPGNASLIGWTIGGTGGPVKLFTGLDDAEQPAYDGSQWIQFHANYASAGATLSQTFATDAGQSYYAVVVLAREGTGNESLGAVAYDSNGVVLATNNYQPTNANWTPSYFTFTADTTATTLELIDTSVITPGVDLLLDDVQIVPVSADNVLITMSPTNQAVQAWSSATFSASATGGISPLTVQWYFGTNAIAGATNLVLTINPAVAANAGLYDAVFTDLVGKTAMTTPAALTVVPGAFTNGSFETPLLPSGQSLSLNRGNTSLPGWNIGGTGGAVEVFTPSTRPGQTAYDGNQWIQFNAYNSAPGATLSQTFTTISGQRYEVLFALGLSGSGNESWAWQRSIRTVLF